MDSGSRGTTAHAHQCCIFQGYPKAVPSRMKLTMREPASMTTDKGSRRVTSYFYSALPRRPCNCNKIVWSHSILCKSPYMAFYLQDGCTWRCDGGMILFLQLWVSSHFKFLLSSSFLYSSPPPPPPTLCAPFICILFLLVMRGNYPSCKFKFIFKHLNMLCINGIQM